MEEKNDMEYKKFPMTEEQMKSKRIDLERCELVKDSNDIKAEMFEYQIRNELPNKQIKAQIDAYEKAIETGVDSDGKDVKNQIEMFISVVKELKMQLEKDIPMRNLRLTYRTFMDSRTQVNSPEMQISKLKKELKEKKAEIYVPKHENKLVG